MTVINTKDSERLRLAGEYLLVVTTEHLSLLHDSQDTSMIRARPAVTWHLDDIPRFRLEKLNQLNDAEKIFIINLARYDTHVITYRGFHSSSFLCGAVSKHSSMYTVAKLAVFFFDVPWVSFCLSNVDNNLSSELFSVTRMTFSNEVYNERIYSS